MRDFYNKKVLIAGGTGLVGIQLTKLLIEEGANVSVASLDDRSRLPRGVFSFHRIDLMNYDSCLMVSKNMDYVFNLLGVKGSPKAVREAPADYFNINLHLATNLLRAAHARGVQGYLYTSTNGVYAPCEVAYEDMMWNAPPSNNDKFAGYAKRMGELQVEAYRLQYGWNDINIVRPSNIYGPYDSFGKANSMVVASLIVRACDGENPLVVWGDGSAERDFIHSRDVARGMILVAKENPGYPVNLSTGIGTSIRELVQVIINNLDNKPEIIWDKTKPAGDRKRILDNSLIKKLGFESAVTLEDGIAETMRWYREAYL